MITTTSNDVANHTITQYLGVVRGIVVRSPTIAQGVMGGLKTIIGGNNESFAKVCEAARQDAFDKMVAHAEELGAHAIIGMRYDATDLGPSITEVLAYGTAVSLVRHAD